MQCSRLPSKGGGIASAASPSYTAEVGTGSEIPAACRSRFASALYRMIVLYFPFSCGRLFAIHALIPPFRPQISPFSSYLRQLST